MAIEHHHPKPLVSARWLAATMGIMLAAAAVCAWITLCILFWQGAWQLLYHPASAITRTPASVGLAFDAVGLADTGAGEPRLKGWWIPADKVPAGTINKNASASLYSTYTVLYLHGRNGNLSDTVDALAALHAIGLNILAFDYRGYGQSKFQHPSEARWRDDAESALTYITETRGLHSSAIILDGNGLGANLALEVAAQHPELAGVMIESPLESPANVIFDDARARLVPARLLVGDRFDMAAPAAALQIPSLWFYQLSNGQTAPAERPTAFQQVPSRKMLVGLEPPPDGDRDFTTSLTRWLDDLHPIS